MMNRYKWLPLSGLLLLIAIPCSAQSDAVNEWKRTIFVQLQLHKKYPPSTLGKGGNAKVAFTLDRTGRLISTRLDTGTGDPALDEAVLEMVRSSEPFPPAPPEADDLSFKMEVRFLKRTSGFKPESGDLWSEKKMQGVMRSICRGC